MEIKNNAYTYNGIPWFDGKIGQNNEMWNIRMKTFLQEHGYDIRYLGVTSDTSLKKAKTTTKK
jgi:hypothetical protein